MLKYVIGYKIQVLSPCKYIDLEKMFYFNFMMYQHFFFFFFKNQVSWILQNILFNIDTTVFVFKYIEDYHHTASFVRYNII